VKTKGENYLAGFVSVTLMVVMIVCVVVIMVVYVLFVVVVSVDGFDIVRKRSHGINNQKS
jgi:hypothetical protein